MRDAGREAWRRRDGVVLLGGGERAVACLRALVGEGVPVRAVAVDGACRDARAEADASGVEVVEARHPDEPATQAALDRLGAPLWVMAGYRRILPPVLVRTPRAGILNLHGGRLPAYRGASVLNWQVLRGEPSVGLSLLWTAEGVDSGPVVAKLGLPLGPDDDFGHVSARANEAFPRMLLEALHRLERGDLLGVDQASQGFVWPKRRPEDGVIDWRAPARHVHDFVRALAAPCPGAFCDAATGRVTVWRARVVREDGRHGVPGEVVGFEGASPLVACGEGVVALASVEGAVPGAGEVLPSVAPRFAGLPARGATP
jgi:methionyl-tRNA formyltransferase